MTKTNTQKPIQLITLFNLIGFFMLWLFYDKSFEIVLYGVAVIGIIWFAYLVLSSMSMDDQYIFLIVAMLFSIGILVILRGDAYRDTQRGKMQIIWFAIALIGFFAAYLIVMRSKWIHKIGFGFFGIAVGLSLFTMIFGKDLTGAGVKNWISVGPFSIQTTEIVKYLVLFMIADRFHNPKRYRLFNLDEGIVISGMVYVVIGIMVLQKELGTILVIYTTYIAMLCLFNEKKRIILINIGIILFGAAMLFLFRNSLFSAIYNTFMGRVEIWKNLWTLDPTEVDGVGALMYSMFAIGSGGLFGMGLGNGRTGILEASVEDYIFSFICQEMGLMVGIAIILMFFLLMYRGLRLSLNIKHKFYRTIGAGICIMFGFQTFIIIGGVTGLIPLTGITLPFVSAGGSSLVVSFMAIGFLEGAANKTDETAKAIAKKKTSDFVLGADLIGDERYSHSILKKTDSDKAEYTQEEVPDVVMPVNVPSAWAEDDWLYREDYEAQRSKDGVFFYAGDLTDSKPVENISPEPIEKESNTSDFFTTGDTDSSAPKFEFSDVPKIYPTETKAADVPTEEPEEKKPFENEFFSSGGDL